MGLIPSVEHQWARISVEKTADIARNYLNLDDLGRIADEASMMPLGVPLPESFPSADRIPVRMGIIRDSAFQFYYPENLEALEQEGAELIFISPFSDQTLPPIDGLYIGGGFPETHATELARNRSFREQIRTLADKGLPIYAECGGLMYLGEKLILKEGEFPMTGILPIVFGFSDKPQGHGYTLSEVSSPNPYYKKGTVIRGHEFHYSTVLEYKGNPEDLVFSMKRGNGIYGKKDGLCYRNVLATYTHIHALGTPEWAGALVEKAARYRESHSE
jgi:cobyrinic acid a,c-diamide synthase